MVRSTLFALTVSAVVAAPIAASAQVFDAQSMARRVEAARIEQAVEATLARGASPVGEPYEVHGRYYVPAIEPELNQTGQASWYGDKFHGRQTASGEIFDKNALTAAHPTLPFGTMVTVTDLATGRSVVVRVNDRGPFKTGRVIDLSEAAAEALGIRSKGLAEVRLTAADQSLAARSKRAEAAPRLPVPDLDADPFPPKGFAPAPLGEETLGAAALAGAPAPKLEKDQLAAVARLKELRTEREKRLGYH